MVSLIIDIGMTECCVLGKSWRVPHVEQEMLTLSGTPDFTSFEFIILLIRYAYTLYYWICQFKDYVYGLMTLVCLLAWISLAALSRTYFIVFIVGYEHHMVYKVDTNNKLANMTSWSSIKADFPGRLSMVEID